MYNCIDIYIYSYVLCVHIYIYILCVCMCVYIYLRKVGPGLCDSTTAESTEVGSELSMRDTDSWIIKSDKMRKKHGKQNT